MKYSYLALFEYDEEDGGYTVTIPDFDGAISEAETLNECNYNARELLEIYTIMYENEQKEMPHVSSFKELSALLNSNADIIQIVTVDTDIVRERERSKVVNKTVTLPSWLVEVGKKNKINFSQLLQKAIREELQI